MFGFDIPWRLLVIGALSAIVLGVIGTQYVTIQHLRAGLAEQKALIAQERANAAQAAAAEQARNRLKEQRRVAAQKEATDEAQRVAARARADAAARVVKHDELRSAAVAAAAASCRAASDPGVVGSSPSAESAGTVLADVLSEMDEAAGDLAEALDLSRVAGQLCEKSYDALNPGKRHDDTHPAEERQ